METSFIKGLLKMVGSGTGPNTTVTEQWPVLGRMANGHENDLVYCINLKDL